MILAASLALCDGRGGGGRSHVRLLAVHDFHQARSGLKMEEEEKREREREIERPLIRPYFSFGKEPLTLLGALGENRRRRRRCNERL
jgi:hypothetical protein